jgi:SPX domain protein involved in polyphosphate accumulation
LDIKGGQGSPRLSPILARHEVWKEDNRTFPVHSDSLFSFQSSQNDLYSEWRPFYIDYNLLKRELKVAISVLSSSPSGSHYPFKARTTSHSWDAADEQEFTNLLEGELDKIHDFQKAKVCVVAALPHLS